MPGPIESLLPSHAHNTLINSGKSDNLNPNSYSIQNHIKMRDRSSLAMFDGMVSDAPNYNHFESFPPQTTPTAGFSPWTPWSETQQLATQERTTYGHRSDQCYTSLPIRSSYQGLEHQKPTKYEPWPQGIHQEQAPSASYSDFPVIYGFPSDHDPSQTASIRHPILPLPTGAIHQRSWNDSDFASTRNEIVAPQPRHSHDFPFDAADASGTCLYSSASNLQVDSPSAVKRMYPEVDDTVTLGSCETDNESAKGEPPYAKLIYNALMDAREHKLVLRDIYAWINDNTDKAREPAFKGWQNSVRHNLSMNGAFMKVPYVDPANKHKKGFIWVLDPAAVGKGIESTTRYRQKTIGKKSDNPDLLDPKRQRSGRKGGRAARKSAKVRRSAKLDGHDPKYAYYLPSRAPEYCHSSPARESQSTSPSLGHYNLGSLPYYLDPPSSESPHPEHSPYSYPNSTVHMGLPADQSLLSDSFDSDSNFLGSKAEDLFGGQDLTAFV